jgi:hypothetical protein
VCVCVFVGPTALKGFEGLCHASPLSEKRGRGGNTFQRKPCWVQKLVLCRSMKNITGPLPNQIQPRDEVFDLQMIYQRDASSGKSHGEWWVWSKDGLMNGRGKSKKQGWKLVQKTFVSSRFSPWTWTEIDPPLPGKNLTSHLSYCTDL